MTDPTPSKARHRAKREQAEQKRQKAYLHFLAGYKLREIADMVGYSSRQAVWSAIQSYREHEQQMTRNEARLYVIEVLQALKTRAWPQAANGDLQAINTIAKLERLHSEIAGLFAPRQVEHSGPEGGPIELKQLQSLSEKELDDLLAGLFAQVAARAEGAGGGSAGGAGAAGGDAA